jgi:hypothetical protein
MALSRGEAGRPADGTAKTVNNARQATDLLGQCGSADIVRAVRN